MTIKANTRYTHAEYMLQTLLYIVRLVDEGDYSHIHSLGMTDSQALRICRMSMEELHTLAQSMRTQLLKLAFDEQVLEAAFAIQDRKLKEKQQIETLVLAGASYPVMAELYGMAKGEFTQLRRKLGLSDQDAGRYNLPDETLQAMVWSSLVENADLDEKQRLVAVHQATGVKVRAIWALWNHWAASGLTPLPSHTTSKPKTAMTVRGCRDQFR